LTPSLAAAKRSIWWHPGLFEGIQIIASKANVKPEEAFAIVVADAAQLRPCLADVAAKARTMVASKADTRAS
jgi:phosphoglucomutase